MNLDKKPFSPNQFIDGIVIAHFPYGFIVDLDDQNYIGIVPIIEIKDIGKVTINDYPPINTKIKALILGISDSIINEKKEIYLSIKPSIIR